MKKTKRKKAKQPASPARVQAGKRMAAINKAKKQAAESGQIVILEAFGISVNPDGTSNSVVPQTPDPDFEEVEEARPDPMDRTIPALEQTHRRVWNDKGDPELVPVDLPAPKSKLDAVQALIAAGMSEDAAFAMVGGVGAPVPTAGAHGVSLDAKLDHAALEREQVEQQAAYQARMANYTEPVLDKKFTVTLKMKFADYVQKWAAMETVRRRREVTEDDAIQMMVRRFWQNDAERALLDQLNSGGATAGPADNFDPTTGQYA